MWKENRFSFTMLYSLLCFFLGGYIFPPAGHIALFYHQLVAPPPSVPLTKVDWANLTYFSPCYENTRPFYTRNGSANNNGVHFSIDRPTYGDLMGDQQPEAVIPYQCSAADAGDKRVFVYTGDATHIRLIGDLPPLSDTARTNIAYVTKVTIRHQELSLEGDGYSPQAARCCPDLFIKTSYRWNGNTFTITQYSAAKRK